MGGIVSNFLGGGESTTEDDGSSPVLSFHSSARWQLHYKGWLDSDSSKLMVIDFTATWCGPCKFMAPAFQGMAEKFTDVCFIKIDVDQLPDVAQEYAVQAMPTFLLMKNGKEVDRVIGAKKDELEKKVAKHRAI